MGKLTVSRKAHPRKAFTRDSTIVEATKVKTSTFKIKDVGAPGRGKKIIKITRKGALTELGYSTKVSPATRHKALRAADKKYGSAAVFRMLQAQVVFRKRTQPQAAKIFEADRNWVETNLLSKQEKLKMTKAPRQKWMRMSKQARSKAMPGGPRLK